MNKIINNLLEFYDSYDYEPYEKFIASIIIVLCLIVYCSVVFLLFIWAILTLFNFHIVPNFANFCAFAVLCVIFGYRNLHFNNDKQKGLST